MKTFRSIRFLLAIVPALLNPAAAPVHAASAQLLGWNNLGMHCLDSDFSVFSILPPYNTIEAQLIVNGKLITSGGGYTVTYEAVADPSGSFNSTSLGKGNFYDFTAQLYGPLAVNMGLAGWAMPGANNLPQTMRFEQINFVQVNWFRAEGIPITPYDDALHKNAYPMMRLVARDAGNNIIATNNIVLPVSDEMDCRACHASGSYANALPAAGWVNDSNAERDYRLNILRLHDEREFALHPGLYAAALAARGFNAAGLYAGVVSSNQPALCAACHASEALGTSSYSNIPPLTASVHAHHATVPDPTLGITLDNSANRAACYRCHPGSTTKCLRGAMGAAVAPDGSMAMQCQSCHGSMSRVGAASRTGWLMEPKCQSCHTGTATSNSGQIRFNSVFDSGGAERVPADATFATQPNTPAAGLSLYRFSSGHGGLQCAACHGSTHAEFPSTHANDNIRNLQLQGHIGVMVECTACHTTMPSTANGGPHGMHPVGQDWVNRHPGLLEGSTITVAQCQSCHGLDYRGTVLSRAQGDRQLAANTEGGGSSLQLFRGATVGCYLCHNGPSSDQANNSPPPTVANVVVTTAVDQSVAIVLPATGVNLTLRIVSQPAHGVVGLNNGVATYFPDPGFVGIDSFTFAAYDGAKNSGLGVGTVAVGTVIDSAPPAVRITSPTSNPTYSATNATLAIGGTASDNVAVASVSWSNSRGGSATAIGTTNWTADGIALKTGDNLITVTVRDIAGNTNTDTLTVTYSTAVGLTVNIVGDGTVRPDLNGQQLQAGKSYTLTAKPAPGWVFAGWSGAISASTPKFTFVFQDGMILQASFTPSPFSPANGNYAGLYQEDHTARPNSSGAFTLRVTSGGAFSGKLLSGNLKFKLSGQFDASGHAHAPVSRPNMAPLSVELQLDLTNGTDQVTGTVSDGIWTSPLSGDRAVFDGRTNAAPQLGGYTMVIPGGANPATEPYGFGYATLAVDKKGNVRLRGALADGIASPFNIRTPVSKSGRCPLYLPLYRGQGYLQGWLQFASGTMEDLNGEFVWFKPASPGSKFYPQGFTLETAATGSRYLRPPAGTPVLDFTSGKVVLDGGNLSQNITNTVTLSPNNQVTGAGNLSLRISLPAGSFKGKTTLQKPTPFSGVLLQKRNAAYGFFLGTDQSGKVYFGP